MTYEKQSIANTIKGLLYLLFLATVFLFGQTKRPVELVNAYISSETVHSIEQPVDVTKEAEKYIKTIFGKHGKVALAVANGECGGLRQDCKNVSTREYSVCQFQINIKAHFAKIPGKNLKEKEAWLSDYQNCTLMAKVIYADSGFQPWSAFTNGNYLQYLK